MRFVESHPKLISSLACCFAIFFQILILWLPVNADAGSAENQAIFDNQTKFTDEANRTVQMADYRQGVLVITSAYSSCRKTCPLVTMAKLLEIQKRYQAKAVTASFVIVSLDPENDDVEVLKTQKAKYGNRANWHFLRTSKEDTSRFIHSENLGDFWNMDEHVAHKFVIKIVDPIHRNLKRIDWDHADAALAVP